LRGCDGQLQYFQIHPVAYQGRRVDKPPTRGFAIRKRLARSASSTKLATMSLSFQRTFVQRKPMRQWGLLLTIGLAIAGVWLGLLPKLARHPTVQQRQAVFAARGIDPAAMFYTELELLDSPHNRLRQWQRQNPDALW